MSTKTWVFGPSNVILRWFYGKFPFSYEIFQTVITWVFWKRFEVCKSLKYSSWSQLSNEYKNLGVTIIPCDPTVIWSRSVWKSAKLLKKDIITWVFWKRFQLFKSLKYSSCSQLSNEYKNMGVTIIPCDPTVILRKSVRKITVFC